MPVNLRQNMANKKVFEILELLKELASGREVALKAYCAKSGLSERTLRRYMEDLKAFFGKEHILKLEKGSYVCKNGELFKPFMMPNKHQNESEKLIDLLHVINPGFAKFLPPTHKKVDDKLAKELAEIFLIKGSPHENTPNLRTFAALQKAIKFKRYCELKYLGHRLCEVKVLKLIYCKGNWQVATLRSFETENNGFEVLRAAFIEEVKISTKTFYADEYTLNFIKNSETFWDGYKVAPYPAAVAVSPSARKYFVQKRFFKSQKISDNPLPNGWTKIEFSITSDEMLLMLAKRWFPNLVILEPLSAKRKFEENIGAYDRNSALFEIDKSL